MLAHRLPRSWSAALEQIRRDVTMVGRRAAGRGASPLLRGTPGPERARADALGALGALGTSAAALEAEPLRVRAEARELEVARVVRETAEAVTIVLRAPDGEAFAFRPGQFFTVLAEIDGQTVPRNYSASNAPGGAELHLTIKRKREGRVSGVLTATAPGARLRLLGPFGSFVLDDAGADAAARGGAGADADAGGGGGGRRLVLVAGGAGITPLMSIARTVLASEPASEIALVYANVRAGDVIFAAELDALVAAHGGRLTVSHLFGGRLDRAAAARALADLPLAGQPGVSFYVCGPDGMRDEVLAALAERGIDEDAIRIERFAIGPRPQTSTSSAAIAASVAPGARPIAIRVKGRVHRTVALPGATVLEAGLAAGAPMPFSCGVGGCGACRVKLVEGDVELEEPNCLSGAERAAGYVLACVGRPCGPCVVEVPVDPEA